MNAVNDEFKIQLKIADKHYPLYCKRSEEWIYRRSAKLVNDRMMRYSSAFADAKLEKKDLLVMVALHSASDNIRKEDQVDTSPLFDKIEALNNELEEYLRSNS